MKYRFRHLTEEEKKAFIDSLDANGKQILRDLAGEKPDEKKHSAPALAPTDANAFSTIELEQVTGRVI